MKRDKSKEAIAETQCPACDGTGFIKISYSRPENLSSALS
jgi:hypothetical protein